MKIIDVLKSDEFSARLSLGSKWLVWDEDQGLFVVYSKPYGKRITKILIETGNEELAVEALVEGIN